MAGFKYPNSEAHSVNIRDGTLCRAESPRPGPVSPDPFAKRRRTLRILGFDGVKVHDFLFQVALAEIQWQDLDDDPRSALDAPVPKDRANERVSKLYDLFLNACSEGPRAATGFLSGQHSLQKKYLLKSKAILESLRLENANREVLLSRMLFGAQALKSAATAGIAVAGLFLGISSVVVGAEIALGYEVVIEFIKPAGPSNDSHADAVLVGFRQAAVNDAVTLGGSIRQKQLAGAKEVLVKTLSYPNKSSTYRSAVASGVRLDVLLRTLGVISAGVTLYTEIKESMTAWEQMERTKSSY